MRSAALCLLGILLSGFSVAGKVAPITVKDISGKSHSIPERAMKATVLIFVGTDCPISNRLAPEMSRITQSYSKRGVAFFFVYPDPEAKESEIRTHRYLFGLGGTAVIDRDHALVKLAKALATPQAAVFLRSGEMVYTGRINNLYSDHNRPATKATRHELRSALEDVLAGRRVSVRQIAAVGCTIPPLRPKKVRSP